MIDTKQLSKQMSDLNETLGLFRKQVENIVAVNSDKNQIYSQVSSTIREYVSMYTGLQMLHSTEQTINDKTDPTRQSVALTPFIELRDKLVRMRDKMEISTLQIPLINSNGIRGMSIKEPSAINVELYADNLGTKVRILGNNYYYPDALGAIELHHDGSDNPVSYKDDFRLVRSEGRRDGSLFAVYTFLIPKQLRKYIVLYISDDAPRDTYTPWCFNIGLSRLSEDTVKFAAEILFKPIEGPGYYSVAKQSTLSGLGSVATNFISVQNNMQIEPSYSRQKYMGNTSYFSTRIPDERAEDGNNIIFTDAPLVSVTRSSLDQLITVTEKLISYR